MFNKDGVNLAVALVGQRTLEDINALRKVTVMLPKLETRIDPAFFINEQEIMLNKNILEEQPATALVFDCEMYKLPEGRGKVMKRYFQVRKNELMYYTSIYSSSVWNERPLFRVNMRNILHVQVLEVKENKITLNVDFMANEAWQKLVVMSEEKEVGVNFFVILKFLIRFDKHKSNNG